MSLKPQTPAARPWLIIFPKNMINNSNNVVNLMKMLQLFEAKIKMATLLDDRYANFISSKTCAFIHTEINFRGPAK